MTHESGRGVVAVLGQSLTSSNLALDRVASLFIKDGSVRVSSLLARPLGNRGELRVSVRESVSDQNGLERNRNGGRRRLLLVEGVDHRGDIGDVGSCVRFTGNVEGNVLELGELFVEKLRCREKRNDQSLFVDRAPEPHTRRTWKKA